MASNRTDDHEVNMLSLHLVQMSLVYVNTPRGATFCRARDDRPCLSAVLWQP
jgi:hypothetical protein